MYDIAQFSLFVSCKCQSILKWAFMHHPEYFKNMHKECKMISLLWVLKNPFVLLKKVHVLLNKSLSNLVIYVIASKRLSSSIQRILFITYCVTFLSFWLLFRLVLKVYYKFNLVGNRCGSITRWATWMFYES